MFLYMRIYNIDSGARPCMFEPQFCHLLVVDLGSSLAQLCFSSNSYRMRVIIIMTLIVDETITLVDVYKSF